MYREGLAGLPLELPAERDGIEHAWHLFPVRLRPEATDVDRDQLIAQLAAQNIGTSVHFIPVHLHPYYRDKYGWRAEDFPVALGVYERLVSIPMTPSLTDSDVEDIIAGLHAAFARLGV